MKKHGWNLFVLIGISVLLASTCYGQASAPANEISFDFSQISTDTSGAYTVKARYYSSTISYCYLRITDVRKINYPVLMMRLDSSHNKLWITTFIETYFSGQRDTSSIFLADYSATSVTKLYDRRGRFIGVEVDWTFTLCRDNDSPYATENGEWATESDEVYFGVYVVGNGENGYNDSSVSVQYVTANDNSVPEEWANNRGLYVWGQSTNIINQPQAQREFFSFITAPHGNPNAKISTVLMNFDSMDIVNTSFEAVSLFIADAHSRGLKVVFLSGDPSWALDAYRSYAVAQLQKLFQYNAKADIHERFDGVQFNIEPHVLPNWPSNTIWGQYIQNLAYYQDMVDSHNALQADTLIFGATIPYWYDEHTYNYRPVNEYVQDIVDCVTVINYWTTTGATGMSATEIAYSELLGEDKSVFIALETKNLGGDDPYSYVSFWNHGNELLEQLISELETLYSQYSVFSGTIIHYYETDAANDEAYRKLRPDALSQPNQDYNSAPVATIVTPNSGEFASNSPVEIAYTVYDADTNQINVSIFVCDGSQEIQVASTTVNITAPSRLVTATATFVPATAGVETGEYFLQIVAQESANGLIGTDTSNGTVTIMPATVYQPPVANAGGPYTATEGATVLLDARGSLDPQDSPLTYEWDINNDGIFELSGATQSISRPDETTFTVTVRVTNNFNLSAIATADVTFLNVAPVVNPLPNRQVSVGESVGLPPATYSDAGQQDTHIAIINWGDNVFEQYGVSNGIVNGSHVYSTAGTYLVTVTVQDNAGAQGSVSFSVMVQAVAGFTHEDAVASIDNIIATANTLPASQIKNRLINRLQQAKGDILAYNYVRAISRLEAALDQSVLLLPADKGVSALIEQLIADLRTL
ncbi:MAG: PKD domain-containing protein [Candidatus Auribacterota bacterium]|jgi:hypothetical protein|nr:PKD domain-containing protein [Candidatus Auribacterota bacterium]